MPDQTEVWRYVDGEMSAADAAALEADAAEDPALRALIDEARLIREAVLEGAPRPSAGFAGKVVARAQLQGVQPGAQVLELRRFLRRVLVAAAVMAAVGIAYMAIEVVPDLVDGLTAGSDPLLERR